MAKRIALRSDVLGEISLADQRTFMTVDKFHDLITQMIHERMSVDGLVSFFQHKKRSDKYLREEYLAIRRLRGDRLCFLFLSLAAGPLNLSA